MEVVSQRECEHSSPWGREWKRIELFRRCEVWGGHLNKGRQIVWFILLIFQWQYFVFFLTNKFSMSFGKKKIRVWQVILSSIPMGGRSMFTKSVQLHLNLHNNSFEFTGQIQTCLVNLINSFSLRK